MTSRLDIKLISALCLLLAVTLGSCSQIYDSEGLCEGEQSSGNRVNLKFKIYTDADSPSSRGLGEWEEKEANVAERILNPNDMRVMILSETGNLIRSVKASNVMYLTDEGISIDGITGDGFYDVSVFFEDDNLDRMDDDKVINFQVLIFANINSLGGIYTTDGMLTGTSRDRFQEIFTMSPDWFPTESKGIPMYGYKQNISATKAELTRIDGFTVNDRIFMLRAMSKIEVFDNIEVGMVDEKGQKYPYIQKVEMLSWRDKGYVRPLYDGFQVSGTLKTAYIPSTSTVVKTPVTAKYIESGEDGNADGKGVFRLYCPEAHLSDVTIRVTAVMAPGEEDIPDKHKVYEVPLGKYADGGTANPVFGNDMVRNHIYRFNVTNIGITADLTVKVSPWGHQTEEYTLDNVIQMGSPLTWILDGKPDFSDTEVTYNGKTEKQLSMLNGTTDYVTGKFTISSPKGAVWRAYFIPGENGTDAFEFVNVDASGTVTSTSSYVEGNVGEEATISIRGKGPADAYRHTAELVVEVRQVDGTVLYAPITASGSEGSERYIIYRENKF